ncbi:cationic amino acid transporter KNAG_0K02090 [Huiozyma naganishii CBS 8797]|uniref:PQ-loop repeat-containing protein n=1 Tax=Huiozyma naganishii (strain ATCC MYA-139 / BCRC 22969 / CBS 8797 / KCTC 17520 / NBRC 10181 / NCYC 3082 / Yp74L-3) TaxID=1071383 RepID=J7RRT4_HUIN7|nr:hypothetical protein KNAG_0K02090 [Kazachstania naganishii CBS 8797]CCK72573.1 hypothetical protein KNAG_0K02090 [Kazachstania naganishii CBS 8797]
MDANMVHVISSLPPVMLNRITVSEITGTISIACWIVVFVPQIYKIFKRKSANGLSVEFLVLWLIGDVFNIAGAMLQGLLFTVILLAAYYTLADVVLLVQCFWYSKRRNPPSILSRRNSEILFEELEPLIPSDFRERKRKRSEFYSNTFCVLVVIFSGFLSWYASYCSHYGKMRAGPHEAPPMEINGMAQVFGYLSAILYLSSRVPQILLNYRRKSCQGVSFLFFVFACLGNTLFILSVLIVSLDYNYLKINFSWLLGSAGTLLLDVTIFLQFFIYSNSEHSDRVKNTV